MKKRTIIAYCIIFLLLIASISVFVLAKKGGGGGVPCDGRRYAGGTPYERGVCIKECGSPEACWNTHPGGKGPGCEIGQVCNTNCECEWVDKDLDGYTTTSCGNVSGSGWLTLEEVDIVTGRKQEWVLNTPAGARSFRIIQTRGVDPTNIYSVEVYDEANLSTYAFHSPSEPFVLSKANKFSENFNETITVKKVVVDWDDFNGPNKARLELFAGTASPTCDCDDNNPYIHPLATEICDNADNNCNGEVDEGGVCKKYIYLCKSDSFVIQQEGNGSGISLGYCRDGAWCSSEATGESGDCTYETAKKDIGQRAFYTYVCDTNNCYKFTQGGFLVCSPGWKCTTVCKPGECNYATKEWCNTVGMWQTIGWCQSECGKTDSVCGGNCQAGACDIDARKWCSNGYWTDEDYCNCNVCGNKDSTCTTGCSCKDGDCDTVNNKYCKSGLWKSDNYCYQSACCQKDDDCITQGICDTCKSGTCDTENNQYCLGGTWTSEGYCDNCECCDYDCGADQCETGTCDTINKKYCKSGIWIDPEVYYCNPGYCGTQDTACECANTDDECCSGEEEGVCDPDCLEGGDPDCGKCTPASGDCCDDTPGNGCDKDCPEGVDPDCQTVCNIDSDGCCSDKADDNCDPDCTENSDVDCKEVCTSNGGDCCVSDKDGVCDPDCASGTDPDCKGVCNTNADGCCSGEADSVCDPDCTENSDADCKACTSSGGDCCVSDKDGVCDSDCVFGIDPDCHHGDCRTGSDDCCSGEADSVCDPDCTEGSDPDCKTCTNNGGDCCNAAADGICDSDCVYGTDPDCKGVCNTNADGCCSGEADSVCDPDCTEGSDADCKACTSSGGDCCVSDKDGVCDPDCASGIDPDCQIVCDTSSDDCCSDLDDGICDSDCTENSDISCKKKCTTGSGDCCVPDNDDICDPDCIAGVDPDCAAHPCEENWVCTNWDKDCDGIQETRTCLEWADTNNCNTVFNKPKDETQPCYLDFKCTKDDDKDSDGYPSRSCYDEKNDKILEELDCNDNSASQRPGAEEACNGKDDNCDGTIDEGCPCKEGETLTCGKDQGICKSGIQLCTAGKWGICGGSGYVAPQKESCDDGLDNNCDGIMDENCNCIEGATQECGNGIGTCKKGWQACYNSTFGSVCNNETKGVTEVCDNDLDDDCDSYEDGDDSNCQVKTPVTTGANQCKNRKQDADETGVDCGGKDCTSCEEQSEACEYGKITEKCICGKVAYKTGYCCNGKYSLIPCVEPAKDSDDDGCNDDKELKLGTDLYSGDTDGDGLSDCDPEEKQPLCNENGICDSERSYPETIENCPTDCKEAEKAKISLWTWILLAIIILALLGIGGYLYAKSKGYKLSDLFKKGKKEEKKWSWSDILGRGTPTHTKERPVTKLKLFVEESLKKGYKEDQIRKSALKSGWTEEEINEALKDKSKFKLL